MSKKYYGVKKGHTVGVYYNWDDCKAQVNGFSGAEYKGFKTEEEAYSYIGKKLKPKTTKTKPSTKKKTATKTSPNAIRSTAPVEVIPNYIEPETLIDKYDLIAFVDGSYDKNTKSFGSGIAVLNKDLSVTDYKHAGHDKWDQWNIVGEIESVRFIINLAAEQGHKNICIFHDLVNIAHWASGYYQAKNEYTQNYVRFIEEHAKDLNITFIHVKAHIGVNLNERADRLAKQAIEDYLNTI